MYISKFQVTNFKSYLDSTEVEFKPGFNIITGQNNAGKTALLEALTLQFEPRPHRSLRTVPVRGTLLPPASSVRFTMVISPQELLQSLQSMPQSHFFPAPDPGDTQDAMNRHLANLLLRNELQISVRLDRVNGGEQWNVDDPLFLGFYRVEANRHNNNSPALFPIGIRDNRLFATGGPQFMNPPPDVRISLAQFFRSRIYRFRAERFNVGQSGFGSNATLFVNASNLPEVLSALNENPARFHRLNETITTILPQIRQISVRPLPNNQVEILIWSQDSRSERSDLAIPLNECGSGVGQVIAMLYVVMNSDHPQTIIVDEPQSFLHPGAVRKLIEAFKRYPQHQYIFATHSPAVIAASDPSTFMMVRAEEGQSVLRGMDPRDAKHLQACLFDIGARLSDVFGADNILWVEGQTEEACFPMILQKIAVRSLMGTAIVGIRQTGNLQAREKRKVLEMYRTLSEARTLLPPAVAFIFDQECLTQTEKDDLTRMDRERVHFLPRRMYENYLLFPEAIAAVMNSIEGFRAQPVTEGELRQFIEAKRDERKDEGRQLRYFCRGVVDVPNDWELRIDAAKLLEAAFQELSGALVSYEKTTHSVAITEWIIEHRPDELRDLADFLLSMLPTE